jgi:hypothetical protein
MRQATVWGSIRHDGSGLEGQSSAPGQEAVREADDDVRTIGRPEQQRGRDGEREGRVVERVGERTIQPATPGRRGVAEPGLDPRNRSGESLEAAAWTDEQVERAFRRVPDDMLAQGEPAAAAGEAIGASRSRMRRPGRLLELEAEDHRRLRVEFVALHGRRSLDEVHSDDRRPGNRIPVGVAPAGCVAWAGREDAQGLRPDAEQWPAARDQK